jgi:3-hydroxyacyl-CoA dehydrogenase/enoyl-CoA hydratase/3-hydroxybutyryl-CoA epimerase
MVERRKIKPSDLDNAMARIEGTVDFSGFHQLDIVVEAVVENIDVKKKIFAELEQNTKPEAVLASNTSSLSITEIASATKNPARVVGMHFFNPVDKMPLVEVIKGKDTSEESVAAVFALSKKLGKTPIVVKDGPGFVVNRILGPYLNEAVYLISEGVGVKHIDDVIEKFGMPMGPCALLDEVGLDVAQKVSGILFKAFGERMKPPALFEKFSDKTRLGRKTGKGIYLYEKSKRGAVDSAFIQSLGTSGKAGSLTDDQIEKRLIFLMVNEASRIVEEGLVRSVADVDIGMIYGTGFAPFRGGLLRYADRVGAEVIVSELEIFSRNWGPRFQPSSYLQQLAVQSKKFY